MYQSAAITTFTGHRSPVGLVFDADSSFKVPFKGAGFHPRMQLVETALNRTKAAICDGCN